MLQRPILWRLALFGSGAVIAIFMWAGGVFEHKKAIVIDYSMYADELVGAEVYIDDALAGTLQRVAKRASKTGFEVSEGAHVIRIEHSELGCEPVRVETQSSTSTIYLIADIGDFVNPDGSVETRICFN